MAVRSVSISKGKGRAKVPGAILGFRTADLNQVSILVAKGLTYSALERFQTHSGLSLETIGHVVQIPARTRARRKVEGKLSPHESERLYRLAVVYDKALQLFEGDAEAARNWLNAPSPALSNRSPLQMTETEIGARSVENVIGRLEHGVFT